jgi:hypothetical protein
LLGDYLRVGALIRDIARLVFGLRQRFDSRGSFRQRWSAFRGGAGSKIFEAGKRQAANESDKDAELDRNKMCDFQVHFPKPPPGLGNLLRNSSGPTISKFATH